MHFIMGLLWLSGRAVGVAMTEYVQGTICEVRKCNTNIIMVPFSFHLGGSLFGYDNLQDAPVHPSTSCRCRAVFLCRTQQQQKQLDV